MRQISSMGTLLAKGYAHVDLTPAEMTALERARRASAAFFSGADKWKRAHGDAPGLFGWRPYGMQFSDDPAVPDECESFAYWADDPGLVPGREDLGEFIAALGGYWAVAADVTASVLDALAAHYGYPDPIDFQPASYIEVNAYGSPPGREYLQTEHEDGHLLTIVKPNKPGLEVRVDGVMVPWKTRLEQVTVMAGSLLTTMTGGEVPPLYHQVRNYRLPRRLTVLYFANLPFSGQVRPYAENDANRGVDLAELSRQKCTLFGKPLPQVLA